MKNRAPYIVLGLVAFGALLIFNLMFKQAERISWVEHYNESSKSPYGTYVVHQLLREYFAGKDFFEIKRSIYDELEWKKGSAANYVFIGEAMYLDTNDIEKLLEFVKNGNTGFIASKTVPFDLMLKIYSKTCNNELWEDYFSFFDSIASLNLTHPRLVSDSAFHYTFYAQNLPRQYAWQYIDKAHLCKESYSFAGLGTLNDSLINFVRIKYGEGAFYFHTTPISFTNFYLIGKEGKAYAERVFSHLAEGPVYWDRYSRVPEFVGRNQNHAPGMNDIPPESPLKYVLAQPSLAWAWYLSLLLAILFLLFRAKRKQRMIPVLAENKNTSLEFISTIGSLYFNQNDHRKLSLQKIRLFAAFVRNHYNIPTKHFDDNFVEKLAAKSEIPEEKIRSMVLFINNVKSSSFVSEKSLIDLHQLIDQFYKNCK